MDINVYYPTENGYKAAHCFEGWKVAYLTYAERFDNITYLENHLETDEVFVLLKGKATLLVGEKSHQVEMENSVIYNIPKGVWHNIKVSKDALVFIAENSNTGKENTQYKELN